MDLQTTNSSYYITFWFATSALVLILALLRFKRPTFRLPPGPKPWPIIGNLNLIGPLVHRSLHDLSVQYGPLMYLRLGSKGAVVGSSVEMAKIILKTMDATFAGRPKTAAGKYTAYNYSDIAWSQYGPYWRQGRRIFLMELLSTKRIESFEYIRVEEMKSLLKGLFKLVGKDVLVKDHLSTFGLNIISRMVLGKRYFDKCENSVVDPDEFKKVLEELILLNGVVNIGDWIPWLGSLDLQGYVKRMKCCAKKIDKFFEHVLDEHNTVRKEEGENFVAKDMVDVLLQLADDPDLEVKFERDGVKAFTQDILAGGTESSSFTVEWAISELLKKPEVFKKATEELDRVIGRERWVTEKDIPNLPYIQVIVKETMRLHPGAPLLIPHQTRENCQVDGYDIPEGTRVFVNVWTIGRDPKLWEDPDEFFPDRFIGKSIDAKGQSFELLPFGSGRRMCPGYSLGLKLIESTLANLLHGFEWKLPRNMMKDDLNMEEFFGLSLTRKFRLVTVAEPRLPLHVYADL